MESFPVTVTVIEQDLDVIKSAYCVGPDALCPGAPGYPVDR